MPFRREPGQQMEPHDSHRFSARSHGSDGRCSACSRPPLVDERSVDGPWRAHCYEHAWDRDAARELFGIPLRKIIYVEPDATMRHVERLVAEISSLIGQHESEYW